MTCKPEGTHHYACECREKALADEIAALKARVEELEAEKRNILERATAVWNSACPPHSEYVRTLSFKEFEKEQPSCGWCLRNRAEGAEKERDEAKVLLKNLIEEWDRFKEALKK